MEKRFVLFVVLTMLLLTGHMMLRVWLLPPPPVAENPAGPAGDVGPDDRAAGGGPDADSALEKPTAGGPASDVAPGNAGDAVDEGQPPAPPIEPPELTSAGRSTPTQWLSFGSYDSSTMLVTTVNRGAAIVRIELTERDESGDLKYLNLEDQSGYLGHLALTPAEGGGCVVNVVGAGTPAAAAGVQVGDVVTTVDGQALIVPELLDTILSNTKPNDAIELGISRAVDDAQEKSVLTARLDERPFQIVRPEPLEPDELQPHPLSYLLSVPPAAPGQLDGSQPGWGETPSLSTSNWEAQALAGAAPGVEFRYRLGAEAETQLELIKRFRLGARADLPGDEGLAPYHLNFELEIVNHGDQPRELTYQLDGPTGLPLEGWWYSHKIHPRMFASAGARDIVIRTPSTAGVPKRELYGNAAIYKTAKSKNPPTTALFPMNGTPDERTVKYLGVDTQYFLAGLLPNQDSWQEHPEHYVFGSAEATALGDLEVKDRGKARTVNVTFQLMQSVQVPASGSVVRRFMLFSGPKKPELLAAYGLQDTIYYGWFGVVSRPLSYILHFFYSIVGNYGLAIIMLTVLVRGCMFPLSRKAAKNAAMMQQLAPEMKKITEKYKSDMEKRAKAQQELFRKHNYNPLGGCWLMFLQLPIFLGLYRCLSVDIELRQAALIPGISWCSNLAGPDKLFYWENNFLGLFTETGMLGPYFNVLPLITIAMFLIHQKLFMPPPTDEQTRMQMKMMNFMMVFMGVMFFKVASGLCLYFIASSLWGIAERKLLPKPSLQASAAGGAGGGGGRGGSRGGGTGGGTGKPSSPPRTHPPTGGGANGSNPRRARAKRNKRR